MGYDERVPDQTGGERDSRQGGNPNEENEVAVLPWPGPRNRIQPATAFRSTWVVSSINSLREQGHFDRYVALLPDCREELLSSVAGIWLPIAVARAHYEACEALSLALDQQIAMGRAVGERARGSWLAPAIRAARAGGVSPWTILPQLDRLWRRAANGGAAAVFRMGPKEARAELVGCELLDVPYFRQGMRGVLLALGELFSRKLYVHETKSRRPGEAVLRMQWV
jgi:hypothetical protein